MPLLTFCVMAASCAESMLAMFVALALRIHLLKPAWFVGSKAVPFALTRFWAMATALLYAFAPFLFDQKPRVRPPPGPRQRLPKETFVSWPALMLASTDVAVVAFQFCCVALDSMTPNEPGSST